MRYKKFNDRFSDSAMSLLDATSFAENPVVQTIYTADPAPMVYNDTFFIYTG
jgi:arabinoxylan arabinofuranohydrolase